MFESFQLISITTLYARRPLQLKFFFFFPFLNLNLCANLILFILCLVLVIEYIYQTCIPTRAYHTLQGVGSIWIEESTLGVFMHMTVYIHRKQRRSILKWGHHEVL